LAIEENVGFPAVVTAVLARNEDLEMDVRVEVP